ncbi:MAG: epoxyalkane--coenzyme M transferase [Rhodospirillaceae bacterium]|nr:epoxyalkane--coenzyme M transferase [Rhodospirillaceae bacterium]
MKISRDRILVSHVGRLERPELLTRLMAADPQERPSDGAFKEALAAAVRALVQRQAEAGIDVVCDGEAGKLSWVTYATSRLTGWEHVEGERIWALAGKDRRDFADYYASAKEGLSTPHGKRLTGFPVFTGPIAYVGHEHIRTDISNLQAALKHVRAEEAFMPSVAPGSVLFRNAYYPTEEAFLAALAEALREEYRAIVEAGLVLQVDEPSLTALWDSMLPEIDLKAFYKACEMRVEALNHALAGIPPERVRVHVCWGSWHGPHTTDMPLERLLPLLGKMNVGGYVLEAGNVRHEHEWQVWKGAGLPEGRVLVPGLVSHATDTVEHPELVAWRIGLFADAVGRENVIAGTDCGLGYRVHDQIAWAKLKALTEGAAIASKRLWGR